MEVSRGTNLVGMSTMPLDAGPLSLFIKNKIKLMSNMYGGKLCIEGS